MATEADLIQKFKDLNIPVGSDFEELIHEAFVGANLADIVNSYDSRIATVETDLTTKADDSKVVHSTDMRKPASDVVGLEDIPNGLYKGSLAQNTDLNTLTQEGIYDFFGVLFVNFIDSDNHWGIIQTTNRGAVLVQCVICTDSIGDQIFFRTQSGKPAKWYPWTMVPRFGMDNRLTLPNGDKLKPANDSKVAHLSGANNFDTVPTVNNNPLLLASSLPSDLARTGQDANFTGKLQKSGIDVATTTDVTNAVNTAVSNSSKYIEASKNDEASAISESQSSNLGNVYYWTEG